MQLYIEFYASLMAFLPPGSERFRRQISAEPGTTVQQLIEQYRIPHGQAHIVLVNGRFVCGEDRIEYALQENDTLAVWPPVAGG